MRSGRSTDPVHAWTYKDINPVFIKRRNTEQVTSGQFTNCHTVINNRRRDAQKFFAIFFVVFILFGPGGALFSSHYKY